MKHWCRDRTAGAWLFGAVLWAVAAGVAVADAPTAGVAFVAWELVWIAAHLALLVGLIGLASHRPAGRSRPAAVGLAVATLGRVVFIVAELDSVRTTSEESPLLPVGALLTVAGMLVTGVAVVRARRWDSWRRFTPPAVGVYPLVLMFPFIAVTGEPNLVAIGGWAVTYAMVGVAGSPSISGGASLKHPG